MKDDSFGVTTLSMIDDEKQSMYVYVIGIRRFWWEGKENCSAPAGINSSYLILRLPPFACMHFSGRMPQVRPARSRSILKVTWHLLQSFIASRLAYMPQSYYGSSPHTKTWITTRYTLLIIRLTGSCYLITL
jgi:hypothetical protein